MLLNMTNNYIIILPLIFNKILYNILLSFMFRHGLCVVADDIQSDMVDSGVPQGAVLRIRIRIGISLFRNKK